MADRDDSRASSFISKNYTVQFTTPSGILASIFVENLTSSSTEKYDPETGELIHFYFGLVTTKDESGDLKLAHLCAAMNNADVHHHTYDAKSGALYRLTRMGATKSRILNFADASNFRMGLNPSKIEAASKKEGIDLDNGTNVKWYQPYEHLSAPYEHHKSDLYNEFQPGSCVLCFKRMITGSPSVKGDGKGCGFDLNRLESTLKDNAFCLGAFPLHDYAAKEALEAVWMPWSMPWKLPTHEIKEYFGEEIGFYFKFLGHLASGLLFLSLFAITAQVFGLVNVFFGEKIMLSEAVFAVFAAGVYSVILDSWRYDQNKTAHLWEVYGCQKSVPPRPGFKGVVLKNPTNGRLEIDFPASMRRPRKMATLAGSSTAIVVMLGTVLSIFIYKAILTTSGATGFTLLVPALLNSVQMTIFGLLYKQLASVMTEFENHRSLAEHNSELFKKLTFFYFINYYASLFYIAFIKVSVEGCLEAMSGSDHCGHELAFQVFVVFVGNDFANRISNSILLPFITRKFKAYQIGNDDTIDGELMGPVELQFRLLDKYDPTSELVMDYIELFVQWGYLVLFGSSCPIVVALAAATNFIETRTDGYKLLNDFRRVVPNRVDGIGEPLNVFYYVLYVSIPVNAGLFVYTFNGGALASDYKVWIFVAIVFGLFFLLTLLDIIFPDIPEKTSIQLQRQKVMYERVVLGNPDVSEEALDLDIAMIGKSTAELKKEEDEAEGGDVNMTIIVGDAKPDRSTSLDRPTAELSEDVEEEQSSGVSKSKPTTPARSRASNSVLSNNDNPVKSPSSSVEMQEKKQRKKSPGPGRRSETKAAAAEAKREYYDDPAMKIKNITQMKVKEAATAFIKSINVNGDR